MGSRGVPLVAGLLLGIEALGVLILTAWMAIAFASGDLAEPATAVALLITTLVGAAALAAFAVATARDRSWGRSGGVVAQLLILAIALGAITGAYADASLAGAIALPAVVTLIALIVASRRAARDETEGSSRDRGLPDG